MTRSAPTSDKPELCRRVRAALAEITPEDLTIEELTVVEAAVSAAAARVSADPATRIRKALDAIELAGWTRQQLSQVALVLESIVRSPSVAGFRPHIVRSR